MSPPRFLSSVLAAAASLFGIGCAGKAASSRYHMAADLGARQNSRYVRDQVTGQWAFREIELRLDTVRPLPDPISDDQYGDKLSMQLFKPGMVKSGGLRSATPMIENGYRIWRGFDGMDEADLVGRASYGVQVSWPKEVEDDSGTRHDPMEMFPMEPLGEIEPGVWTEWYSASSLRGGAFGWWEEVHGKPIDSLPMPEHPFQIRWRLRLDEVPGRLP